jgi:hypothetical protein
MTEIDFQQISVNSRHAGLLPAGYTLVSGTSSSRVSSKRTISSGDLQ